MMSFPSLLSTAHLLLVLSIAVSSSTLPGDELYAPSPELVTLSSKSPSGSPAPASTSVEDEDYGADHYSDTPPPPPPPKDPSETSEDSFVPPGSSTIMPINWCAARDEIKDCRKFMSILNDASNYTWNCEKRDNKFECMQAIQKGDADVMSLDAGTAYVAFINYQMKAIMMEEYCYFAKSYDAVAVVNKEMCDRNPHLSLGDFKGMKSCHSGHLTAAGWNYPIQYLVDSGLQALPKNSDGNKQGRDEAVLASFFSLTCAPSELEGHGLCTSCGNNGSCTADSLVYGGNAGAFRCLVDGTGDIAFVRSDTIERLSADGKHAQEWSTKPLDDFRYLCPQGGCRSINENIGNCTFGSVPANVLMTRNSQPNVRRLEIVQRLLNASYSGTLYNPQNWNDYVLSSSAQNLIEMTELTRQALGSSASVAQMVQTLGENRTEVTTLFPSGSSTLTSHWLLAFLLTFLYHLVASQ